MEHKGTLGIGAIAVLAAFGMLICGAAHFNLAAATAAMEKMPATIIIDAGHGGEDGGTTGITGASESQLNLEIALRLEPFLTFCGYKTLMVRTTDTAIYTGDCETYSEKKVSDLKNRVDLVNRNRPSILISIHQNHFPREQYSGVQVLYAGSHGSKQLAGFMQNTLQIALEAEHKRQCQKADSIYLLDKITSPGVLIECGFLSNSREEALLQQPNYQKKIVCAIADALTQYTSKGESELEV